jgi:hypothetical protein
MLHSGERVEGLSVTVRACRLYLATAIFSTTARVPGMQKWEYATVPLLVHATKQILDNWGEDGWELVAVIPGPNPEQLVAYLKRPKE